MKTLIEQYLVETIIYFRHLCYRYSATFVIDIVTGMLWTRQKNDQKEAKKLRKKIPSQKKFDSPTFLLCVSEQNK